MRIDGPLLEETARLCVCYKCWTRHNSGNMQHLGDKSATKTHGIVDKTIGSVGAHTFENLWHHKKALIDHKNGHGKTLAEMLQIVTSLFDLRFIPSKASSGGLDGRSVSLSQVVHNLITPCD